MEPLRSYSGLVVTAVLCVAVGLPQTIDQVYTGVYFSPFTKHPYGNGESPPTAENYTTEETRAMLEIILEKFSKVTTWGVGSKNVSYIHNVTYYNESDVEVYISEVAANINRGKGKKGITIFQGIRRHDEPQMKTEVQLAIECAIKANHIFRGTVEGLVFTEMITKTNQVLANQTLNYLMKLKNSSVAHLKLGTTMGYSLLSGYIFNKRGKIELKIFQDILQHSNFVVCAIDPRPESKNKGAIIAFESISTGLLELRRKVTERYIGMEVVVQIGWASEGFNKWNNVKNMRQYWEVAGKWGKENSFPIWFHGAFDTPFHPASQHMGRWRLTDNSKSDQRAGYIEKILEDKEFSTTEAISTVGVVSITLGLVGLFVMLSLIAVMFFHIKRLQQQLSKEDIRQFMEGMSNEVAAQQDGCGPILDTSVLRFPYESSFEIQKDQLNIQYNQILGMGQFGCVFKAMLKSESEESKYVALKVARDDAPRSALKGLLSEIKILIYIGKHANIVTLMGAYTAELLAGIVYIATELCILGSLQGYLRKHEQITRLINNRATSAVEAESADPIYIDDLEPISCQQMIQWSQEIACGMEHLGTKNVVHADLATRNVLLTVEKTAKITDFGLSRKMYDYTKYIKSEQEPMPWRWMAIESLKRCEFSAKSDVWSYGVTLWEIFSLGTNPYPGLSWTTNFVDMLDDGLRLKSPAFATTELYQLMIDCWHTDVEERLSFTSIHQVIKNLLDKEDGIKQHVFVKH